MATTIESKSVFTKRVKENPPTTLICMYIPMKLNITAYLRAEGQGPKGVFEGGG